MSDADRGYSQEMAPPPPPPPVNQVTDAQRLKGVGGWLLLFCISLTFLNPAMTLYNLYNVIPANSPFFARFPGLFVLTYADAAVSLVIAGLSIYAGIALWRVRPRAVAAARTFLIAGAAYVVLSPFAPLLAGLPKAANDIIVSSAFTTIGRGIVYYAIWLSYLSSSKRVQATYASVAAIPGQVPPPMGMAPTL